MRRATVTAWLERALACVDDEVAAARRLARHGPPGADRHVWRGALSDDGQGPLLLTRPVPFGVDVDVVIEAWDRPLATAVGWEAVVARALAAHAALHPDHVRLRWPASGRPPLPPERTELDHRVVAAPLRALVRRRRPWGWSALEARPATDLGWLPQYHAAAAAWAARFPRRAARVQPADLPTLQRCQDTGAVVCAWSGDTWIGVAAAEHAPAPWFDGYRVRALFLDDPARGQRRAPVLLRHLVDSLADHGLDAVWGVVPRVDDPALHTSLRVGGAVVQTGWRVARR